MELDVQVNSDDSALKNATSYRIRATYSLEGQIELDGHSNPILGCAAQSRKLVSWKCIGKSTKFPESLGPMDKLLKEAGPLRFNPTSAPPFLA